MSNASLRSRKSGGSAAVSAGNAQDAKQGETKTQLRQRFTSLIDALADIFIDTLQTIALLLGLVAVRSFLGFSHLPPSFEQLFDTVHQYVFLANYGLLAFRGLARLASNSR